MEEEDHLGALPVPALNSVHSSLHPKILVVSRSTTLWFRKSKYNGREGRNWCHSKNLNWHYRNGTWHFMRLFWILKISCITPKYRWPELRKIGTKCISTPGTVSRLAAATPFISERWHGSLLSNNISHWLSSAQHSSKHGSFSFLPGRRNM